MPPPRLAPAAAARGATALVVLLLATTAAVALLPHAAAARPRTFLRVSSSKARQREKADQDPLPPRRDLASCELLTMACATLPDRARCQYALSGCGWAESGCVARCNEDLMERACFMAPVQGCALFTQEDCEFYTGCEWFVPKSLLKPKCQVRRWCKNPSTGSGMPTASTTNTGSGGISPTPTPSTRPTAFPTAIPHAASPTPHPVAPTSETRSPTQRTTRSPTTVPSRHPVRPTAFPSTGWPTQRPSKAPRRPKTKSPVTPPVRTRYPTAPLKPSRSPRTKPPTTAFPTLSPNAETAMPTVQPTVRVTPRPTGMPAGVSLCTRPQAGAGCGSIKDSPTECTSWSGCKWDAVFRQCQDKLCVNSEFDCGVKALAMQASQQVLPRCRSISLATEADCNRQRESVYAALELGTQCDTPWVSAKTGGGASIGFEDDFPSYPWLQQAPPKSTNPEDSDISSSSSSIPDDHSTLDAAVADDPPPGGGKPPTAVVAVFVSSSQGKDTNPGTARALPVQTLVRAVALCRERTKPSICHINVLPGGVHRLPSTLILNGRQDDNLVFEGSGDATISGSVVLDATWREETLFGVRVKVTDIPAAVAPRLGSLSHMFVDGRPAIRARFPNVNAFVDSKFAPADMVSSWMRRGKPEKPVRKTEYSIRSFGNLQYVKFSMGYGGPCQGMFSPPAGYFCNPSSFSAGMCPYDLPSGCTVNANFQSLTKMSQWEDRPKSAQSRPMFHVFHPMRWSLWSFETVQSGNKLYFTAGGSQEARGDCGRGGGAWFVENAPALLDSENEFFLDLDSTPPRLYYLPNSTVPWRGDAHVIELTAPSTATLISVRDTDGVQFRNLRFMHTYAIHMEAHEMPSGGDWTVHRSGALLMEGVHDSLVWGSWFSYLGGHGVFLSRSGARIAVTSNEFEFLAGSAVMVVGNPLFEAAQPWDRTSDTEFLDKVTVRGNVARELGLVLKQSSGVFVAISRDVLVTHNVFYNGPRAGITLNDGFGGNNVVTRNVMWNMVRETNDHGPFNSWDRQRWLQRKNMLPFRVSENFMIGNEMGPKGVDLDDGATNYVNEGNVIVYGYHKFKGSSVYASGNLVLFPMDACVLVSPQSNKPAGFVWDNNTCVTRTPPYYWQGPDEELIDLCNLPQFATRNNEQILIDFDKRYNMFPACNGVSISWGTWTRSQRQDAGSRMSTRQPRNDDLLWRVREKLWWWFS